MRRLRFMLGMAVSTAVFNPSAMAGVGDVMNEAVAVNVVNDQIPEIAVLSSPTKYSLGKFGAETLSKAEVHGLLKEVDAMKTSSKLYSAPIPTASEVEAVPGEETLMMNNLEKYNASLNEVAAKGNASEETYLRNAYGEETAKNVEYAKRFQAEHPNGHFPENYSQKSLTVVPGRDQAPDPAKEGAIGYYKDGRIWVDPAPRIDPIRGQVEQHETGHGAQDLSGKSTEGVSDGMDLADRTILNEMKSSELIQREAEAYIAKTHPELKPGSPEYTEAVKTKSGAGFFQYTEGDRELGVRLQERNRIATQMWGHPIRTPEEAIRFEKFVNPNADDAMLARIAERNGLPYPKEALAQKPMSADNRKKFYETFPNQKDLFMSTTGGKAPYADPRSGDKINEGSVELPNAGENYKQHKFRTMERMIMDQPGHVSNLRRLKIFDTGGMQMG